MGLRVGYVLSAKKEMGGIFGYTSYRNFWNEVKAASDRIDLNRTEVARAMQCRLECE